MKAPGRLLLLSAVFAAHAAAAEPPSAPPAPVSPAALRLSKALDEEAQAAPAPAPKAGASALTLVRAVELTLENDPRVLAEKQTVAVASGQLRSATGQFDHVLSAGPSYSRSLKELTSYFKDREAGKRNLLTQLGEEFARASAAVQEQLANNDMAPPQCPQGLAFVNVSENESSDITDRTGLVFEDTIVQLPPDLARGQQQYLALCSPPDQLGARPETTLNVVRSINQAARLGMGEQVLTAVQLPRETLNVMADITQEVAVKAKLAVERLGDNPLDEVSSSAAFHAGYAKPFRSGLLLRTDFRYQGSERNFIGKSLDPAFGGFGLHNEFPTYLTLSLDMPLGRNRGSVSTAAPERAAGFNLLAESDRLRSTVSQEVFSTVLAYVALQSAQQSLAWLEESAARQQKLVTASEELVRAEELPKVELARARARAALVASQVAAARNSLAQARLTLAEAMGVSVETLDDAPLAADPLPRAVTAPAPDAVLTERALANRRELQGATHLTEAAEVLARAARADLKRRFDFSVTGGFNTLYESPFLRLFPAEQDQQPYENGVRFASLEGPWRAMQRRWRPQISAQIVFELPFRNNAAAGRLAQQEASFETSRVQRRDLERVIRDNVVQVSGSVSRAAEAVNRHREALAYYEKTLDAAMARFRAGDLTLLDTLVTEQDLTGERQVLLGAVQSYLSQLARLRYETGEIVTFANAEGPGERVEFDAAPFAQRQ